MPNNPRPVAAPVNDPAELDRYLAAFTPTTLPSKQWQRLAPDAIALVKRAGLYERARVQNDVSVLSQAAARVLARGRDLTLDEVLADTALLDFDIAQKQAGVADSTREKRRGILRRLQAAHKDVPWRRERREDGDRVCRLPPSELLGELMAVVTAAERDSSADAAALVDIVGGRVRPAKIGRGFVRRWILPRLPYSIIYDDRPDGLVVLAFAHHKQRPGYWRKRLKTK